MADQISYMLDSMNRAVEEGFSYDGIVSIPETGLEDTVKHRPRTHQDFARMGKSVISEKATRIFSRTKSRFNNVESEGAGCDTSLSFSTETLVQPDSRHLRRVQGSASELFVQVEVEVKEDIQPTRVPILEWDDGVPCGCSSFQGRPRRAPKSASRHAGDHSKPKRGGKSRSRSTTPPADAPAELLAAEEKGLDWEVIQPHQYEKANGSYQII